MTYLVVVWLMSNGQLSGEPWQEFATSYEACKEALTSLQNKEQKDRFLFIGGCFDAKSLGRFTGFEFSFKGK